MTTYSSFLVALAAAAGMSLAASGASLAASDDSPPTSGSAAKPQDCPQGQVWDPEAPRLFGKGKCVDPADVKASGTQKQSLIYDYGRSLAKDGQYEAAIAVLRAAPQADDPRVLNYLGFAHRKLGRMDAALGYYRAAVSIDPDYGLVREYLGEAYVQLGDLEKAREQLTEIQRICGGKGCEEYAMLAELIVDSQLTN